MKKTVNFAGFYGEDDMSRFESAMEYLRENPGSTLIVPPGEYSITSSLAKEALEHVLNGDWGENPQRIMFSPGYKYSRGISFEGQKGTTVLAYGVTLMVDGFMEPVSAVNCSDITIKGLTIDHRRKPYSKAVIKESDGCDIILEFDSDCPIREHTPLSLRYIFYSPETGKHISCGLYEKKYIDEYHISVKTDFPLPTGTEFYTVHTFHSRPAVLIERAENIVLEDITIHSQPGMGVVGNRADNITLRRLRVVPSAGHHFSTNTDATHFTSITGKLKFENCDFDSQGDDFTNVHCYFHRVISNEGNNTYLIQEKTPDGTHAQTLDYPDAGDTMELTSFKTLKVSGVRKVVACEPLPERWMARVTFDSPLPDDDDLMLSDITRLPDLEVVGCHAKSHFARSILIKTRKAEIRGNTFENVQGPAIVAAAESWWHEGVCPANVKITGNRIIGCAAQWGEAAGIVVKADSESPEGQSIYNVVIEDNLIDAPNAEHGIYCRNVDGLQIARNMINVAGEEIVVEDCINIK